MKLIGFTAPRKMAKLSDRKGGFLIPLFGSLAAPHVASGHPTITQVCPVDVSIPSITPVSSDLATVRVALGQPGLFAFEGRDGSVHIGPASTIAPAIRAAFPAFDDLPFTQTEMADFLGDRNLWDQAMNRCAALMDAGRQGAGVRFRENNPFTPREPALVA